MIFNLGCPLDITNTTVMDILLNSILDMIIDIHWEYSFITVIQWIANGSHLDLIRRYPYSLGKLISFELHNAFNRVHLVDCHWGYFWIPYPILSWILYGYLIYSQWLSLSVGNIHYLIKHFMCKSKTHIFMR